MSVLAQLFVNNLKAASLDQLNQYINSAAMPATKSLAQRELDRRHTISEV